MSADTLFLRLEGPLQAWGNQESKFVVRRTVEAPTKSGVIGMMGCAMGLSREEMRSRLPGLAGLSMGVRIDRPGVRWWDYHTVGAKMNMQIAQGKTKPGAMLTRREYLSDASFLVVVQGELSLITELREALAHPKWTLYLGRKCCPPSRPILEKALTDGTFTDLPSALCAMPWQPRRRGDQPEGPLACLMDWRPTETEAEAPDEAEVWYDVPLCLDPPAHAARFVLRRELTVGSNGMVQVADSSAQWDAKAPPRPRADYTNGQYRRRREERLDADRRLCVFCKSPATTVQHITYRRAGGNETPEDLRSLCRLCHDAVTMIEYGLGMGLDRINPEEERWRNEIIRKRDEIIRFRSLETRRRKLAAEEVE
jgi:CRISPR system Cascade subunit CasD